MAPFMVLGIILRERIHLPGVHIKAKAKDKCISCSRCNKVCLMGLHAVNDIKIM